MNRRLDYLDNLRTALTILVIIFHTSIAYGASGSWILVDVDTSDLTLSSILLTLFTAVCQSFFMGLFFFISFYFAPLSYDRKGAGTYLKDRLLRLGIPLALYYVGIGPITVWYAGFRHDVSLGGFYRTEVWSLRQTFFGPTWFLEASIYFTILYVAFRLFTKKLTHDRTEWAFPSNRTLLASAVGIGLTAYLVRFVYPAGQGPWELQFGYFPMYILLFMAGILACRHQWLHRIPIRTVRIWGWVAVCAIPVLPIGLILTGALEGHLAFEGGLNVQAVLYALWEPFICFGIILMLLHLFQNRFHTSGPLRKWMSAHAYTVYLIHPPIIVGWTMAFHGIHWPPSLKWVIVSTLSVCVCFLAAGVLRFLPGAKRIL